jgi:hypothetical protein
MSQTIEQRLQFLEVAFAEVKKAKGIRGPAGPIDAAVRNATVAASKAVADAEDRVTSRAAESFVKFTYEISKLEQVADKLRQDVADLRKYLDDRIHNTVDAQVVQTLQDYHLLDANHAPSHWSK